VVSVIISVGYTDNKILLSVWATLTIEFHISVANTDTNSIISVA